MSGRKWYIITAAVLVLALAAGAAALIGSRGAVSAGDPMVFEQGRKVKNGCVSVVDLRGTWREMGRQYGKLMESELRDVYAFTELIIEARVGNSDKADSIVQVQTRQTPYRIREFFEGAAETSGFTVEQLQRINAVERIAGLPRCSAAAVWGDYAASSLVFGRNYDYADVFAELYDDVAVTVYHPADGALAAATVGYVGEIYAVNALNEKGIFLELNNGKPSAPVSSPNDRVTGTTMLFSSLFECDELGDLELFFNTVNCSSSYIINAADSSRAVFDESLCKPGLGVPRSDGRDQLGRADAKRQPDRAVRSGKGAHRRPLHAAHHRHLRTGRGSAERADGLPDRGRARNADALGQSGARSGARVGENRAGRLSSAPGGLIDIIQFT